MMEYQFDDLGYCFQGNLRPAKMTQNGTFYCIYICLYKTVRPYTSFIIGCSLYNLLAHVDCIHQMDFISLHRRSV